MTIEALSYLGRIQRNEIGLLAAAMPFFVGCLVFWMIGRISPAIRRLGRAAVAWGGVIGAVIGLMLTSTTYACDSCASPTPGCRVVAVGLPFRQQTQERESEPNQWSDVCRIASESSTPALLGNFGVGVLGFPGLLALYGMAAQRRNV